MSLEIVSEATQSNVHVLHLIGRLTQSEGAKTLRDALEKLRSISSTSDNQVILDLSKVEYIDSTGMGELVSGFIQAQNNGQRIVLAALSAKARDLLTITKLLTVFEVYDSVETANKAVAQS